MDSHVPSKKTHRCLRYRLIIGLVLLAIGSLPEDRAWALIVFNDDGDFNTEAPEDDPGWDNIGFYGSAGAVYLGNRWIMMGDHVKLQDSVTFVDRKYDILPGSEIIVENIKGIGLTETSDLRMQRLAEEPGLPSLEISDRTPDIGEEVLLIGRGLDREEDLTFWDVERLDDDIFIWTEVPNPPFTRSGFKWTDTRTKRWGTNIIEDDLELDRSGDLNHNLIADINDIQTLSIVTRFDENINDATEFESQATLGDSGGTVFYKDGDDWILAGVMLAIVLGKGQPDSTAVFENYTVSADLSFYRDQILDIISAAPVELQAGDANQDHIFDQFDLIKVLTAAKYLTGESATWGEGDWNGAPGGEQGSPPSGNGLFDQFDIIAAAQNGLYLTGSYAALDTQPGDLTDGQTSLVYDAGTGNLSVNPPVGKDLTSINIDSAGGLFKGDKPNVLSGSFDNFAADNMFKATFGGSFGTIDFGPVLAAGLSHEALVADLSVVGSLQGGGDLGEVDLIHIPEPTSLLLLLMATVGIGLISRGIR